MTIYRSAFNWLRHKTRVFIQNPPYLPMPIPKLYKICSDLQRSSEENENRSRGFSKGSRGGDPMIGVFDTCKIVCPISRRILSTVSMSTWPPEALVT
jgi:hypothetical protein